MPPTKFQLNPNYPSGADVHYKIFKLATKAAILDIGMERI